MSVKEKEKRTMFNGLFEVVELNVDSDEYKKRKPIRDLFKEMVTNNDLLEKRVYAGADQVELRQILDKGKSLNARIIDVARSVHLKRDKNEQ